jgi:MFS family permease
MRNIIILGLTSLFTDIASEMVYPLIPFFLTSTLGAGPAVLGVIEGIAESTASLLKVASGFISDRLHRRKTLTIAGYSGSMIGKVLLYAAGSWTVVLGARVIDRIGKGIRTAPRDALIAESADPETRGKAFGLHRSMDTAGAAIGVALAFLFFTHYTGNYRSVFLWSLVPAAIGVLLLIFVREVGPATPGHVHLPSLSWNVLPKKLRVFLIITFIFTLGNSSNTFLLLRAGDLGFTPGTAILLYLVYNLSYAFFSYPAGRLSDRLGRKSLLVTGYAIYGLVYLGFALLNVQSGPSPVWALFSLYGLHSGVTEGVEKALVADLAPGELRGTAIGLHATIVGIGLLPASLIAGQLWAQLGPSAAFLFGGGMGLLSALGLFLLL